jgi:glycolate oxidase FAD binding subunit
MVSAGAGQRQAGCGVLTSRRQRRSDDDWPVDLIDWAGARRFCSANGTLDRAQSYAASAGGHASRLGCGNSLESVLARPIAPLAALQQRVKQALDPHGVFNPGRLQEWL